MLSAGRHERLAGGHERSHQAHRSRVRVYCDEAIYDGCADEVHGFEIAELYKCARATVVAFSGEESGLESGKRPRPAQGEPRAPVAALEPCRPTSRCCRRARSLAPLGSAPRGRAADRWAARRCAKAGGARRRVARGRGSPTGRRGAASVVGRRLSRGARSSRSMGTRRPGSYAAIAQHLDTGLTRGWPHAKVDDPQHPDELPPRHIQSQGRAAATRTNHGPVQEDRARRVNSTRPRVLGGFTQTRVFLAQQQASPNDAYPHSLVFKLGPGAVLRDEVHRYQAFTPYARAHATFVRLQIRSARCRSCQKTRTGAPSCTSTPLPHWRRGRAYP